MISRRLFLKAAGALLGAATLPLPVASAAGSTPVTIPGGTMRFATFSGFCLVAVPLTLERLPGAIGFKGQGIVTASGTVVSCTWTLPNGEEIDASVDINPPADIRLGTRHLSLGGTLFMDGRMSFEGPTAVGDRFHALECYRSFLGSTNDD